MSNIRNLVKKFIPTDLFKKIEPTGHLIEAVLANIIYGFPSKKMRAIGVTGTNGKTTTVFLIHKMLVKAGYKVGMLSTVAYGVGDDIKPQVEHMTTVDSLTLQKRLRDFKKAGVEWVVIETSSHALAQNRVWGIPYEIAVMTNVTKDHLDYHGTFKNYLEAKRKLFLLTDRNPRGFGIINADDSNADKFIDSISDSMTYGVEAGNLIAQNIKLKSDYVSFKVESGAKSYDIRINIPGDFNVSNGLAAVAVGLRVGLSKKQIQDGILALESVEGRMNVINEGQNFKVIIDFASTPDAFEKLFNTLRPAVSGKLIAVFGSAGRRDEAKRAIQGEIAGKYADEVVLTEEDDRDVDGNEILKQIADGAKKAGKTLDKNLFLILDREEAIEFALKRAKYADDMVVFLGKGHEKTIERADGVHPWNETEVVRKSLHKLIK